MKKTLAIILSMALVICMIPATASVAVAASGSGTVTIDGTEYEVTISETSFIYDGTPHAPTVTVRNKATNSLFNGTVNVTFGGHESDSAEKPTNQGNYVIWVQLNPKNGNVGKKTDVGSFNIEPLNLSDVSINKQCDITKENLDAIAGADDETLKNTYFRLTYGGKTIPTDDYTLKAEKNSSVGNKITVKVTPSSTRNLEGTAARVFTAVQSLTDGYTVHKADGEFVYTGSKMTPKLVVSKGSEAPLRYETDYTVSCPDLIYAGSKGKVTVIGIGDYSGTLTEEFTVEQRPLGTPVITPEVTTVAVGASSLDFSVTVDGIELKRDTDYKLGSFSTKEPTNNGKVTITGIGNYKGEYKEVSYRVVPSDSNDLTAATLTLDSKQLTYNGSTQAPIETVKIGNRRIYSSAYTIKYKLHGSNYASTKKPKNCGVYDVVIESKSSGYTGSKTFEYAFEIKPMDINSNSITATFNSGNTSNPVTLKLNGSTLERYYDYDVDDYLASRTYYTVTGKDNFTGTRKVYKSTRSISGCTIDFDNGRSSVSYGPIYYPKVTVYDNISGTRTKLAENTDYTLTYKNSKNQEVSYCRDTGTYSVIVTGKGAYTGSRTLTFTIGGTDISGYTVTLDKTSVNATGYNQTPVVTSVKKGSSSSLTTNDYTVSYQDSNGRTVTSMYAPGTYKVIVTGRNGYSGSTYATFRIVGLSQTITVDQDSYKVYKDSDPFKITAKATGDGTGFTYSSSNSSVAGVSLTGMVTPYKVGRAVITVTTTGNKKYEPTSKTVVIKVYPDKVYLSKKPWAGSKPTQMKVRWYYQEGVTKYQVRYSRDKKFGTGTYKTKTVRAHGKDFTTQSTTISKLKRGYTYYFKVRAVYTDPNTGESYYGSWSPWRSAKTK